MVTLLTAQNTQGVTGLQLIDPALVAAQLAAVLSDVPPGAIKTGALGSAALTTVVAETAFTAPLVVDPVMVSKHGHRLIADDAISALRKQLLPRATLITPNLLEAEALLGRRIETRAEAEQAALGISREAGCAVLLKAAALPGDEAVDLLAHGGEITAITGPRIDTPHRHGTGCTYAAAITANLARGFDLRSAIRQARDWLTTALQSPPAIGQGLGPVSHLTPVRKSID